jgi:hypothetical protein
MRKVTLLLITLWWATEMALAQYTNITNLPTVYIETFDGRGISSKTEYKYCRLHYVDEEGQVSHYDSVSIRGRGNSTWNMSKKPYRIKFNTKEKFLGKGYAKAKKWTLLANAADKTMMRNALTSALGKFTSLKFNPAAKFVDMVLNGSYVGTYQISDQVDVRPHRVNITEQDYPLEADADVSGGYLLEVDGFHDGNCFYTTRSKTPVRIHYPDEDEIAVSQNRYIRNYINEFEAVLESSDFDNPETGYRAYVDSASLIDWYICTEVSANIDGFYSTYFYKDQNDPKFYWGPLWDYDIAYNNDQRVWSEQWLSTTAYSLMADIAYSGSKRWVNRMWEDSWFQHSVYQRYHQLLQAGLVDYMQRQVDSLQTLLYQSQELNYERWGISRKMYHEMVLYSTYDEYVDDLRTFVTEHCAFLDDAFAGRKPVEPTPPFTPEDMYYHIVNVRTEKAIDDSGDGVVQYTDDRSRESEDWYFRAADSGYMIINRASGKALTDPTVGEVGPDVNVGTQLTTATPDPVDQRQQWLLQPQGTDGYYNLENVYSQHIANLNGGSYDDGAIILSYTNDSRNATSQNRLWFIQPNEPLPPDVAGIKSSVPDAYALAYDPINSLLHFASGTPEALTFKVRVTNIGGATVGTFRADEAFPMSVHPAGVYIVTWMAGGKLHSVKFSKIK